MTAGEASTPKSPTERLELRKQVKDCKVCAWLLGLDEKARKEWTVAIANPRYGPTMIASEIAIDGGEVSADGVANHRAKAHR